MVTNFENIALLFKKMKSDGFCTDKELKWGFYFVDNNKLKLEKVYEELIDHKYVLEAIERIDKRDYQLHVSKIEVLDPLKLHKRNVAFNDLADYCNVRSYDGWDVEKIT